jgi:hypothetical protein
MATAAFGFYSIARCHAMLTISPEKVCYIIVKAREFDAKVDAPDTDEGSDVADDRFVEILEDYADDPTYQELVDALEGLNEDELQDLVTLLWIGRGDFTAQEWNEARSQAGSMSKEHDQEPPQYLVGTPLLADYLEEGLSQLDYSCDEFEMGRL